MRKLLLALLATAGACVNISTDPNEVSGTLPASDGPTVQFDPTSSIIPFPNDLIPRDASTGKLQIPASCNESPATTAVRTTTLNQLTGFGTYETAIQVTFTDQVDPSTLANNLVMYQRTRGGAPNPTAGQTAVPITVVSTAQIAQYSTGCANATTMVTAVTFVPLVPLTENSTYSVAVLNGVKTADGTAFIPSTTWALIRGSAPVTFDSSGNVTSNQTPLDPTTSAGLTELQGLATLYKADQPLLQFLEAVTGKGASDILLAWDFTTQVTVDPLNPSLAGSPASTTSSRTFGTLGSLPAQAGVDTQTYLVGALGSANCAAVGCAAVGDVVGGLLNTVNYQTTQTNPDGGSATPGPWNDPVHPTQQSTPQIQALIFLPAGSPPTGGWPFVIFGHGLGEQKEDLFAIAPQLAAAGYATAAVDDVDSGSRAIQTSTTAALGCSGTPTYSAQPQCFTQILSTDLATTRDNIRQTVLDYLSLSAALKACGTSGCAYVSGTSGTVVAVNGAKLGYVGQSLGGIIGTTFSASSNDIKAAVLNVPGVGLLDILENTANLSIRCSLVNGLINAGVVTGDLYTGGSTGLCLTEDWQKQASYQQFASVARWVLDPADGANYLAKLAPKKFIIQEVDNDQVVPNIATNNEGMLLGLTAGSASDALPASASSPPAPSSGVAGSPRLWLKYFTTASHAYQHGSLLSPVASQAGLLGTEQMQVDAITFMALNNH